jgi:hypothetical protein
MKHKHNKKVTSGYDKNKGYLYFLAFPCMITKYLDKVSGYFLRRETASYTDVRCIARLEEIKVTNVSATCVNSLSLYNGTYRAGIYFIISNNTLSRSLLNALFTLSIFALH